MGSAGSAAAPAQESNVNGAGPNLSSFLEAACPRYAAVKVSLCLEWPQKSPIVENLLVLFPSCLTVLLAVLSLFFLKKIAVLSKVLSYYKVVNYGHEHGHNRRN